MDSVDTNGGHVGSSGPCWSGSSTKHACHISYQLYQRLYLVAIAQQILHNESQAAAGCMWVCHGLLECTTHTVDILKLLTATARPAKATRPLRLILRRVDTCALQPETHQQNAHCLKRGVCECFCR